MAAPGDQAPWRSAGRRPVIPQAEADEVTLEFLAARIGKVLDGQRAAREELGKARDEQRSARARMSVLRNKIATQRTG